MPGAVGQRRTSSKQTPLNPYMFYCVSLVFYCQPAFLFTSTRPEGFISISDVHNKNYMIDILSHMHRLLNVISVIKSIPRSVEC